MNILIILDTASLGGHALSALTTANLLAKRGHHVAFATGPGFLEDKIKKKYTHYPLKFFYYHGQRQTYFTYKSLKTLKQLSTRIKAGDYDHIHAFDARSYILASILSIIKGPAVTCTLCGGITPYYNIPDCGKLILFSIEQKVRLINVYKWDENKIDVNSSRLDMAQFENPNHNEVFRLCEFHGIEKYKRNILMITNFLGPKVKAIKYVIEAIPKVLSRYPDVSLVFIGDRGEYFEKAKEACNNINMSIGRKGVIFTGAIFNAQRILSSAYIVLGVGRSAFEGMAHRKPTLIIGDKGYAGTVNADNIQSIWRYNFSGRNNPIKVSTEKFCDEIFRLLNDSSYYESVRHFGAQFLESNIDIRAGISRIEKVYQKNIIFANDTKKIFRILNLFKILSPIFLDNHYNSLKSKIFNEKFRNE